VVGKRKTAWVVASETCAFSLVGADFLEEFPPGKLRVYGQEGIEEYTIFEPLETRPCIFEHIYFARPDSFLFGENVYEFRKALGEALAREAPVEADLVVPVPDSGVPAALGYARTLGLPFEYGLIRSHYIGRTFIEPEQTVRYFGVRLKLSALPEVLRGKRVVIVDDSIVRGTTSRKIVELIREAGAREVHLRISSPPITHPCFYGIDTPTQKELIAHNLTIPEIARFIGCDSLGYLSLETLTEVARRRGKGLQTFCHACFSGEYAVPPEGVGMKLQMHLFEYPGS
jgi:amidophosphoribosyltransferase